MGIQELSEVGVEEVTELRPPRYWVKMRTITDRRWFQATASIGTIALIAGLGSTFSHLTGLRLLYILPLWLLARVGGLWLGLLGAVAVASIIGRSDAAELALGRDLLQQNGVVRFLALAIVVVAIVQVERKLKASREMSIRDPLTGVLNRTEIQSRYESAMARVGPDRPGVAFALVDCDRFKEVNDTHGHAFGDMVLCVLASGLESAVGSNGSVGRMGGDEFVLLFDGVSEEEGFARMAEADRNFAEHMDSIGCQTTMSFGLAFSQDPRMTFQNMHEAADGRMYAHKRSEMSRLEGMIAG